MFGIKANRFNERALYLVCSIVLFLFPWNASSSERTLSSSFVIKAKGMLDVRNAKIVSPAILIIKGGVIEAINPTITPKNLSVIDLSNEILLPGLIDMHTHITSDYFTGDNWTTAIAQQTSADWALQGVKFSRDVLNAGFTTIRDLGAQPGFPDVALMRAINSGYVDGPDIWPAGHAISMTGGHCDWTGYAPGIVELGPESGIADGISEVIKAVRYQAKYGVRVIKVCATGGVFSFSQNAEIGAQQYALEELKMIVREARKLGLKVAAHAHGTKGINAAIIAGVDSIEHGSMLTEESVKLMKEHGTFLVPQTYLNEFELPPETPAATVEKSEYLKPLVVSSLNLAYRSGVKMAFGSDSGVFPHIDTSLEFESLLRNGISEADAIRMATVFAAELLGVDDRGELAPGKRADIIAVSDNPLESMSTMKTVKFVMKQGVVYKN